jgi:hypothetical protein
MLGSNSGKRAASWGLRAAAAVMGLGLPVLVGVTWRYMMHDTTNTLVKTAGHQGHSVTRPTKSAVVYLLDASDLEEFLT